MSPQATSYSHYRDADIVTILIQASFLLVLNVVNTLFDKLICCGLLGQVFVGVVWGTPCAKLLCVDAEKMIFRLGFLDLILLVYEGEWQL